MITHIVNRLLGTIGLSLHRKSSIGCLITEVEHWRANGRSSPFPVRVHDDGLGAAHPHDDSDGLALAALKQENCKAPAPAIDKIAASVAERRLVDSIEDFGHADFAEFAFLFESNLTNHRIIGQRFDEAALLWRAAKYTSGPILEVGRDHGGSTVLLLAASGSRPVVSIDRSLAPFEISQHIFTRPDVARRLTLHTQSSRENIAEDAFGLIFVDGDHSYEGLCHDIATFWNKLKSYDGRPPLAVFHDAVENPVAFVPSVKKACDELIAERGAARHVESAGSLLVLQKLRDIDQERWYAKVDEQAWSAYSPAYRSVQPTGLPARLRPERSSLRKTSPNVLVNNDLDHSSWIKRGVTLEPFRGIGTDTPIQLVREEPQLGPHLISTGADTAAWSRFSFTAFLRPVGLRFVRLVVKDCNDVVHASIDFRLDDASRILNPQTFSGVEILDATLMYQCAFFHCELSIALSRPLSSASFGLMSLSDKGEEIYAGSPERGFFLNLASVREIR